MTNIKPVLWTLKDEYATYADFQTRVIDKNITIVTPSDAMPFLTPSNWPFTFEYIYNFLINYYIIRDLRYKDDSLDGIMSSVWRENIVDLFYSLQVYLDAQLKDKLKAISERGTEKSITRTYDDLTTADTHQSVQADSNTGEQPQTLSTTFDSASDYITNKMWNEFKNSSIQTGSWTDKVMDYNILLDLKRLFEVRFEFGLKRFADNFHGIFRQYYAW